MGFFYEDEPYGKFVEYDIDGNQWAQEGVYMYENDPVKYMEIESFEVNTTPNEIKDEMAAAGIGHIDMPHHLSDPA